VKIEQVIAELVPVMRGWLNYFHHARCKGLLKNLDSWIRRKPRCYRLKQCKRVITLQRFLERQKVDGRQSRILALSGKGHWRKSGCPQAHQVLNNNRFAEAGLYNLTLNYDRVKQLKETAGCESMPGGVRGRGSNPPAYSINTLKILFDTSRIAYKSYFPTVRRPRRNINCSLSPIQISYNYRLSSRNRHHT
jgi:hypothetical protein